MVRSLWCILLLLASAVGGRAQERPAVRFGALADVQYADQATTRAATQSETASTI